MAKFFLTTPIYYVNARPHIGHAYTTIVADVLARRHRLLGDDTFFLTGTDEHGQKIERSAAAAGIPAQEFTDRVSETFREPWRRMGLTNDDFIRTTEPRHKQGVQKLFTAIQEAGYIYLDTYTGAYCVSDEAFVDVAPGDLCPDCGNRTEPLSESNFYFKLSEFEDRILALIESNELSIQPDTLRNEVLSFVRSGLKDLSISRTSIKWGIPVPGHPGHVIYVWLDALANYMTAVGYGSDAPEDVASFQKWWPADLHLIGKEIARFHCVYWPAFLMAAGLPLPKVIAANGWLLFHDSKMSKSKGNVVRIETILDAFGALCPSTPVSESSLVEGGGESVPRGLKPPASAAAVGTAEAVPLNETAALGTAEAVPLNKTFDDEPTKRQQDLFASDVLRYFLLREVPFGQDGSFSFEAMVTRYNADLANGYGNLVSRTLNMISKYFDGIVPTPSQEDRTRLQDVVAQSLAHDRNPVNALDFSSLLEAIWGMLASTDAYITRLAPWKLAADPDKRQDLADVLYNSAEFIRVYTALIYSYLPYSTASVWQQMGLGDMHHAAASGELKDLRWGGLQPGTKLGPLAPIFPRADKGLIATMTQMEQDKNAPSGNSNAAHDASARPQSGFPEAPIASESYHAAPVPDDPTDPGAGPRTGTLDEADPGAQVAASAADTTERTGTPPHHEAAASGIFAGQVAAPAAPDIPGGASPQIGIDDFAKVELRVAKILLAERIPKADKLLRLEVDLGHERRQILSGIAEWYTPEELVGRRIVVITNLAPRKMRGLESHGMLLAASSGENGRPVLATFGEAEEIPLGSRLK